MVTSLSSLKSAAVRADVLGYAAPPRAFQPEFRDRNCPFTGGLSVQREQVQGTIVRKDTNKTATLEWYQSVYVPKYERFALKRYRIRVHNPPALDARVGDKVVAARTRPLSKTKHHVIIAVLTPGTPLAALSSIEKEKKEKKEKSGKTEKKEMKRKEEHS